ncbi:hypothetical protein [Pontibacter sp. G13]|uniref:OmpP1/FadL family transporter n=1 Tax=Pontibacter sp. G13 TaxID=3074898 RepID=UPI00288905E5|nr:hypothetical protein [Pontibacter sp. G13]WNJ20762.1 hypothetical protein RJD25_09790 [Pontibacter sp. G13]
MRTSRQIVWLVFACCGLLPSLAFSQNQHDVVRLSQTGLVGSARVQGMGGAYSAAGADLSSAYLNPAGLGVYRSSNFIVTPGVRSQSSELSYLGNLQQTSKFQVRLPQIGAAFYNPNYYDSGNGDMQDRGAFRSYVFAFGYHQLEDYAFRSNLVDAYNERNSITQDWAEQANGFLPSELFGTSFLAYETFGIDRVGLTADQYFAALGPGITQSLELEQTGRRGEWFVSLAGNIQDKVYLGGTIGMQTLSYSQTFRWTESDVDGLYQVYDTLPPTSNGFPLEIPSAGLTYEDRFSTSGVGINARFGVIFKPSDAFRFGISAQTPTFLALSDSFSTEIRHALEIDLAGNTEEFFSTSEDAIFDYNVTTSFKVTAGGMYLIPKQGFITLDVDYMNYASGSLQSAVQSVGSAGYYSFNEENQTIAESLQSAVNVRVGGEYRIDIFRFRAGGAWYGSPYDSESLEYLDFEDLETTQQIGGDRRMFTLGLGVRQPNFYWDVSLVSQSQKSLIWPYQLSADYVSPFVNKRSSNSIVTSLGFNF